MSRLERQIGRIVTACRRALRRCPCSCVTLAVIAIDRLKRSIQPVVGNAENVRVVGPDGELGRHRLVLGPKPGEVRFQGVDAVEEGRFGVRLGSWAPPCSAASELLLAGCECDPYPRMPGQRLARVRVTEPLSRQPHDRVPCSHLECADGSGEHFDVVLGEVPGHVMEESGAEPGSDKVFAGSVPSRPTP